MQIIPFLHSKSFDTRTAASVALSQIFSLVPLWKPSRNEDPMLLSNEFTHAPPIFPNFSVQELLVQGKLLLASSGKEFIKPAGILSSAAEVKKARKEAMGRLGLDFLDTDDMDLDKEFAAEDDVEDDAEMDDAAPGVELSLETEELSKPELKQPDSPFPPRSVTPSVPSPTTSTAPSLPDADTVLSARERNRLKRKRKPGNSAFVAAPPSQTTGSKYAATPAGPSNKYLRLSSRSVTNLILEF